MAKLTPAGAIVKWVLVPILILLAGYFIIGPRIGKAGPADKKPAAGEVRSDPSSVPKQVSSGDPLTRHATAPELDVTVRPAAVPKHRNRRSKSSNTDDSTSVSKTQKPDEAGNPDISSAGGQV